MSSRRRATVSPRTGCRANASPVAVQSARVPASDRKSTRLNSSHSQISYAVFCLKKKKPTNTDMKFVLRQHPKHQLLTFQSISITLLNCPCPNLTYTVPLLSPTSLLYFKSLCYSP